MLKAKAKEEAKGRRKKSFNTMLGPGEENRLDAALVAGAENVGRENPIYWIPLDQIHTNPFQPRLGEDEKHILGLAQSILSMKDELHDTMGLQQIPMARIGIMREAEDGSETFEPLPVEILVSRVQVEAALATGAVVELAFGHSRWWAFTVLSRGVGEVFPALADNVDGPALDGDYGSMPLRLAWLDDRSMSDHAATENAQRKNITPLEEAIALHRRVTELGLNQTEAGKPFGLSAVQVSNKIRLLRLPDDVLEMLQEGKLSETHGRALLQLVNAPHLIANVLEEVEISHVGTMPSSRGLIEIVERVIRFDSVILLDEVEADGSEDEIDEDYIYAMEWPAGWVPGADDLALLNYDDEWSDDWSAALRDNGCGACPLRVQLGKDKMLRCTDRECHSAKEKVWGAVAKSAQISQMMERYGCDRVFGDDRGDQRIFSRYTASPYLVTSGACSMENCACMVVIYKSFWFEECERPDAEEAPNMVFACSDRKALVAKENALLARDEPIEGMSEQERERQELQLVRDEQKRVNDDLANAAMQEVFGALGSLDVLFAHRGFLASLADALSVNSKRDWTVEDLRLEILRKVVESNCRDWVTYSGKVDGAGYFGYSEKKLAHFVGRVTGKRSAQPKAEAEPVEVSTWQDDWEEDDDQEWLMIEGMGSTLVPDLVTRPKCALRLVDGSEEKSERAKWWKRYNVLAAANDGVF